MQSSAARNAKICLVNAKHKDTPEDSNVHMSGREDRWSARRGRAAICVQMDKPSVCITAYLPCTILSFDLCGKTGKTTKPFIILKSDVKEHQAAQLLSVKQLTAERGGGVQL